MTNNIHTTVLRVIYYSKKLQKKKQPKQTCAALRMPQHESMAMF